MHRTTNITVSSGVPFHWATMITMHSTQSHLNINCIKSQHSVQVTPAHYFTVNQPRNTSSAQPHYVCWALDAASPQTFGSDLIVDKNIKKLIINVVVMWHHAVHWKGSIFLSTAATHQPDYMSYAFFCVIPRRFGTLYLFHLHRQVGMKND